MEPETGWQMCFIVLVLRSGDSIEGGHHLSDCLCKEELLGTFLWNTVAARHRRSENPVSMDPI